MVAETGVPAIPAAVVPPSGDLFSSPLKCSDDLLRVTQLWDSSGSGVRAALLAGFLCRFGGRPAADLQSGLAGGASLLLARLVAALRLSGSHFSGGDAASFSVPLSPLLAAVRVFLQAQQWHRLAAEAFEAGLLDALLAILRRPQLRPSHAHSALRTLSLLLAAGRRFKEAFSAAGGARVVCELLGRPVTVTPAVAERVERLLLHLHQGNRRYVGQLAEYMCQLTESTESPAQLVACRLLTAVLPRAVEQQRAAVPPLLELLRHPDVQLHVEVAGTLRVLLTCDCRNDVVRGLVALMMPADAIATDDPLYETEPALCELYAVPAAHVFRQQAAAVRVADLLTARCPHALSALLSGDLVGGLLTALASTWHPESQTLAARLLHRLAARQPAVRSRLEGALCAAQMALLLRDTDRLAAELSVAEAARIRAYTGYHCSWYSTESDTVDHKAAVAAAPDGGHPSTPGEDSSDRAALSASGEDVSH